MQSQTNPTNPRPPTRPGNSPETSAHSNKFNSNLISRRRLAASTSNIQSISRSATPLTPTETGESPGTSAHPNKVTPNLNSNRRLATSTSNIQSLTRSATPIYLKGYRDQGHPFKICVLMKTSPTQLKIIKE